MSEKGETKGVGVIGLGAMGQGLAANLAKSFRVVGYDTVQESCRAAAANGVECLAGANEVFSASDVVVLSLPTEEIVASVVDAALEAGCLEGRVIFDTSTTTPALAEQVAKRCSAVDCSFLDAPVTGGAVGAEKGELSIMVGGDKAAFEAHSDVLEALGNKITRIGPSGHGQVSKMVNQMLMAAIYTSVSEAFGSAVQHGADIAKIFEAVEQGGGRSMLLSRMKGTMLSGSLSSVNGIRQHGKDIRYAVKSAEQNGIELPITKSVDAFFRRSSDAGFDAIWAGEMWAVWEKLFGVSFRETVGWEERAEASSK